MSQYTAVIQSVVTGGPFSYVLMKDGEGKKSAISLASPTAALNAIRDDIASMLGTEVVERITMQVVAEVPAP
jgi:hypothetical protein